MFRIQSLGQDDGSQHSALQKAVAVRVGGCVFAKFTPFTGAVSSQNYPSNYTDNLQRTETIQVEHGLILLLGFTAFEIWPDASHTTCRFDHLTIMDGDGTTLMEKSCGSFSDNSIVIGGQKNNTSVLPTIKSTSNVVNLFFSTNAADTMSGWSISWSAVPPGPGKSDHSFHWTLDNNVLSTSIRVRLSEEC